MMQSVRRHPTVAVLVAVLAVTATVFALALPVLAINSTTGPFELEGNAVTNNSTSGLPDDWDRVCHQVKSTDCSTTNDANSSTVAFASQPPKNGTTFTGGGSKDPLPIEGWAWNQGSG